MTRTLDSATVLLDHGTGAKLSRELVALIAGDLGETYIGAMEDSAVLDLPTQRIAVTTDSFVAEPFIFGNGDIGKIAVCGTVNDIAVMGARPLYLTLALILETGLGIADLRTILRSIREAALEAGVKIVAGDTKVVRKGEADGIFINTTGVGIFERAPLAMKNVGPDDSVVLSGPIGNHSVHLLSIREGLGFETRILSDCAPLNGLLKALLDTQDHGIKSVRDVTRGGLGAVLHEYARFTHLNIRFRRDQVPIQHETLMATDMLGIDALNLANEGCLCLFVRADRAARVLDQLRAHRYGREAAIIGTVSSQRGGFVEAIQPDGTIKRLEELAGAELPRLC